MAKLDDEEDELDERYYDEQDRRVMAIFNAEAVPEVNTRTLKKYLGHLKQNFKLPCQLTGIEDFNWEEYYVFGPGSKKEYEQLKKTRPSYTDTFNLIDFDADVDEHVGILVNVRRVSDKKKFTIPLADLEATDEASINNQLLDDYSVWFVNYR